MSTSEKYREDTPGASTTDIVGGGSKDKILSRKNLMIGHCNPDKKSVLYFVLVIVILAVAAVLGLVISMYTIANLKTYNIPVDHSEVNIANVLLTRDVTLIYLPQFPDGEISESQTIIEENREWMAFVSRPKSICFMRKMAGNNTLKVDAVRNAVEEKRPLTLNYGTPDNKWVSRRPTDSEKDEFGSFIWESCTAKEILVMSYLGLPPVNSTKCESFCLPHYRLTGSSKPHLEVEKVNCVPALCENRF